MPLALAGATSGSTTLQATDAVTATLTLPSSTGTLLSTANPQSGGVIQTVQATYSTQVSTSSASYTDTGLTATITPKFSTSKIMVIVCQNGLHVDNSATPAPVKLLRNGTTITFVGSVYQGYLGTSTINLPGSYTCYLDSPATTSALTYKTQFARLEGSGTVQVQAFGSLGDLSTITLMEIAA